MRWIAPLLSLLLVACGARSGLRVDREDAGRDAGARDGGPSCATRPLTLEPGRAEIVYVVDRSSSMSGELEPTTTRFDAVQRAFSALREDESIVAGLKLFPSTPGATGGSCELRPGLDVPIEAGSMPRIARRLTGTLGLFGSTPLGLAIDEAVTALAARPEGAAGFVLVLTDGLPTCGADDPIAATREAVRDAHEARGVDVLFLGIATTEREAASLDDLAELGGRPRADRPRFHDAADSETLARIVGELTEELARCTFALPDPPGPGEAVEIRVGGRVAPRDPGRADGWDWTDGARSRVGLFGATCRRAIARGGAEARTACE